MDNIDLNKIAVIMMATKSGKMSPALYAMDMKYVYDFLEHKETEGKIRGSSWFLAFTSLSDYLEDFKGLKKVILRKDTGKQDKIFEEMMIEKYDISEILDTINRDYEYK